MSEVRVIAHNTIIQLVGKVLTIALGLVSFGIMTRYLGQAGYGSYATVYAFLAIFGILVDLGLQMTTTQLLSDPNENEKEILSNALGMRLFSAGIFFGLATLTVIWFPYPTIVKLGVTLGAIGHIFNSLSATITSFFQKNLLISRLVAAEVVAKIVSLTALVICVIYDAGLLGVIIATVLDSAATFPLLFIIVRKRVAIHLAYDYIIWKKIWRRTWPIALTIALNLIYFKGDIFIMSLLRTNAEVGLYGAPYRVLEVLINAMYLFLGLILPLLAAAAATKNMKRFREIIQGGFDVLLIVTIPMIVGGIIVGESLMVLVAGTPFALSGQIMKILLLATGAIFIASLFGYGVVALDRQREMIKFYAMNAVVSIIAYLFAIYYYSYWGAAIVTVLTELFILLTSAVVLKRAAGALPSLRLMIRVIAAAFTMALLLLLIPTTNVIVMLLLGVVSYLVTLYGLGGIDKKIIAEIVTLKPNGAHR